MGGDYLIWPSPRFHVALVIHMSRIYDVGEFGLLFWRLFVDMNIKYFYWRWQTLMGLVNANLPVHSLRFCPLVWSFTQNVYASWSLYGFCSAMETLQGFLSKCVISFRRLWKTLALGMVVNECRPSELVCAISNEFFL